MLELQTAWGWLIALYLFLAGVSAGAYLSAFLPGTNEVMII